MITCCRSLIICKFILFGILAFSFWLPTNAAQAAYLDIASASPSSQPNLNQPFAKRQELFKQLSFITGIPWSYIAAIDQYERSISKASQHPARDGLVSIHISDADWAGALNPNQQDRNPTSIALFRGLGKDGSGDGLAEPDNDLDLMEAVLSFISSEGMDEENLRIGLWKYYQNTRAVQRIGQFAQIYAASESLDLFEHAFPLPISSNYSYRSTWGARRGWGGLRIHEGTDLFANYGTPVRSTSYGIIETMGWNPYGGWRIGIRDLNNVYAYYAHLSGYNKKIKRNDVIKPGEIIGWVGSSGYGKPGTAGKFPPHLHFGLYRDNGSTEFSFDPYSYLRKWEREDSIRSKRKK